jgi:uncharacterized protein YbcI
LTVPSSHRQAASEEPVPRQPGGSVRSELEGAMVALFKQYYGKGPEAAKAVIRDEYVFLVLEGGLTRNEETLLEAGQEEEIRRYRLAFQESVRERVESAISEIMGRPATYHSQVTFHPFRSFEIFVLESD